MARLTKKHLAYLVKKEAEALKEHARPAEISRIRLEYLLPNKTTNCIYGLATGNCYSDRATELIRLCTDTVLKEGADADEVLPRIEKIPFSVIKRPKELKRNTRFLSSAGDHFSPIEVWINRVGEKERKMLIDYLQGKRKTLPI